MSNKRNAFILAAGLAVGGAASASCNTPSCTGGNNGGDTQTLNNTIGIQNGGVTGTNTLNGTIRNENNISLTPNYSLVSSPNAAATSTSGVRLGDVGSTSSVRLGDVGSNSYAALSLGSGAVAGGSVRDSGNLTLGAGSLSPEQRQQQQQQQTSEQKNQQVFNYTSIQPKPASASAVAAALGSSSGHGAFRNKGGFSLGIQTVAGGISGGYQLGEEFDKDGAAHEARMAIIAKGGTPVDSAAALLTGAAVDEKGIGAGVKKLATDEGTNLIALFAANTPVREVFVADANTKSATTVTLNFHGAAAPQPAAPAMPANLPPCKGKWVYTPKTNTFSCERH